MILSLVTSPAAEPISRVEAKLHLREDGTDQDAKVDRSIAAAREHVEGICGRALVNQIFDLKLPIFPDEDAGIDLPYPPLLEVVHVKYVDDAGSEKTLVVNTDYRVLQETGPRCGKSRIVLPYSESWPTTRDQEDAVRIRFRAGYVTPFTAVAATDIVTAVNHPFIDTDAVRLFNSGGAVPAGLAEQTDHYVRDKSGNTFKLALSSGGTAIDITGTGTGTHFIGAHAVPNDIRDAMLLLIGDAYENRESQIVGTIIAQNDAAMRLLEKYVVRTF